MKLHAVTHKKVVDMYAGQQMNFEKNLCEFGCQLTVEIMCQLTAGGLGFM
jgi:hypothetical protein